jgi:hypothetical protein
MNDNTNMAGFWQSILNKALDHHKCMACDRAISDKERTAIEAHVSMEWAVSESDFAYGHLDATRTQP